MRPSVTAATVSARALPYGLVFLRTSGWAFRNLPDDSGNTVFDVMPAKTGIQCMDTQAELLWIPAFAGMTTETSKQKTLGND